MAQSQGPGIGRLRQSEIFINGVSGQRPLIPTNFHSLEHSAKQVLSWEAFAYIAGGAGLEGTMDANRRAMERWRIVPHMLNDVSKRDTSIEFLGRTLESPFLIAPIGVLELAHPQADLAVAEAAATESVPMIFSNQASKPMEDCAAKMGDQMRLFQLYWSTSNDLILSFVQRAEKCGCSAIVVTLDTTLLGWRTRDLDLAYLPFLRGKGIAQYVTDPVFQSQLDSVPASSGRRRVTFSTLKMLRELSRAYPGGLSGGRALRAVTQFINTYSRPSLTWDDLAFLREHTSLPIFLKGILHPDDARKAVDYGMSGIVVSNHGGRQVDGAIGTLDALPPIAQAINGQIPILFDSGIRSGADAFKALALGAKAVCIGRPYVYALALAGTAGVRELLRNFKADFDLTMGLAGCRSISELTPASLVNVP